jgi:hypothetical protein
MAEAPSSSLLSIGLSFMVCSALVLLAVVFLVLILRHLRNSRQLRHLEQMRSLELGHPLTPPDPTKLDQKYMHNAFWIAFWLVVAVPSATFSGAASAMVKTGNSSTWGLVIWIAAGLASVAAVICATVLMIHSRRSTEVFGLLNNPPKGMG